MLVDGDGEEKKDSSSPVVLAQQQQQQSHLPMSGMTPNPLLAFPPTSSSSSAAATTATTAVTVMKQQQQQRFTLKGGEDSDVDDDDEDIGNGGGSPNNPMDLPMRISIPEQPSSAPSIPLHMMGTSAGMVPNPIMSSTTTSSWSAATAAASAIPTAATTTASTNSMMAYAVPSPLASPTLDDDPENEMNNGNSFPTWPHSSSDAGSVATSASTIHAMANVVGSGGGIAVGGRGVVGIGGTGDAVREGGGNQTLDEVEEDEDTDGEDMDHHCDDEHMHGQRRRRRRRANTIHGAPSQATTTATRTATINTAATTSLPAASVVAAGSSVEEEADAVMMQMTYLPPSSYYDDQADIFGEEHLPQLETPQDPHQQQQQQQHQQYQEDAQQPVSIPSPASPPPSPTMVRSYSFPAVRNVHHQSSGSATYGTIMSGTLSSSGSLYSEHTMSPTSETDSPTGENCWRSSTTSSSVGIGASAANAVANVNSGGGGNVETEGKMEPHIVMSDSNAVPRTQVHFHNYHSKTSKSRITTTTTTTAAVPLPAPISSSSTSAIKAPPPDKRQKRLERNRESARVSRRRRKFYLEELECKVTKLSEEMDIGRMKHACNGLTSVRNARATVLNEVERCMPFYPTYNGVANPLASTIMMTTKEEEEQVDLSNNTHRKLPSLSSSGIHHNITVPASATPNSHVSHQPTTLHNVDTTPLFTPQLSRTNDELQIVQIFMKQQLTSLVQPTLTKFVLWLSLQNEEYYRGTRSASERLSAARIGERLLHRGTTRATPNSGMMWPLICHEIGLSYEQEEKVRNVQRMILSNVDSWVQRHTAFAMQNVMDSVHDVISGGHIAAKYREWNVMKTLTPEQRVKFLAWARRNRDVIRRLGEAKIRSSGGVVSRTSWMDIGLGAGREMALACGDDEYMTSPDRHVAANLYIINHLLSKIKQRQQQKRTSATPPMFVHPTQLKKLSRRPSFESLAGLQAYEDSQTTKKLSRETSFPSTGSLKRSLNDMTLEGSHSDLHSMNSSCQDAPTNGITPMTAQTAGQAAVLAVLSDVMPIVPKSAWYNPSMVHSAIVSSGVAAGAPMAAGASLPHSHNALPTVTSQPRPQFVQPVPSVPHPPKRRHTTVPQSVAASSGGGVSVHQQHQQHPLPADIPDVDEIPMPTPVSVLLRTSDDYFSLFEPQEPSSTTNYATSDQATPYTSSLLSNRHQSAPNFSRWGSSPSHPSLPSAHMAVIPELEPVSVDAGPDFSTTEQINSLSHHVTNTGMLGYSHQSAPQLYNEQPTFLSGSLVNNDAMLPQANEVMPTRNDIIEDFAILEGLPMNMEAEDWAIGEGFDMDF